MESREGIIDKNGNLPRYAVYDSEHNTTDYVVNNYSKDKLVTVVSKGVEDQSEYIYYQYNKQGDPIFIYTIYHDNEYLMRANFIEYEYNKKDQVTYKKQYFVQSTVDKDMIRDYWDVEFID